MQRVLLICTALLSLATPALATAPTVSTPSVTHPGSNLVTLRLRSDAAGTGYFVLLSGGSATAGTGAQTKAGLDGNGAAADRIGSLALVANADTSYTVSNLEANTAYTVAFTADDGTTLQSTCATASFTTAAVTDLAGAEWTAVGAAGFSAGGVSAPDVAMAPDGTPYVVYREGAVNSYKGTVMRYQGGAWAAVGSVGFTPARADDASLAFAPDGTPYVAFCDLSGVDGRATVMKYSGGAWTAVGAPRFSNGAIIRISLAFAPNGQPWVVYQDQDNAGRGTVMQYTGSAWTLVGGAGTAPSPVSNRAIGFAFDGTPVVAGMRSPDNHATLMKFNGTDWEDITSGGLSTGIGNSVCLAFAPTGEPHVAFCEGAQNDKLVVKKFDGTTWTQLGDTGSGGGNAGMLSLVVGGDGTVYVSFKAYAYSNSTVMKYNGSAWLSVGRSRISTGVADYTSITLASDGTPYVAFGDFANGNSDGIRETVTKMTLPAPTLTTPSFTNLGANQVTVTLKSTASGRGYFTLLPGAHATAGTGAQTQAGLDSTGAAAFRSGSLPLTANTAATYTLQNLSANTAYTVCFTADNGSSLQSACATASFTTTAATDLTDGVWVAPFPTRFSPGGASELSLAFTADGAPGVAFRDLGPDRLSGGQATMMTFDGTAWSYVGMAGFSGSIPNDCTLVVAPTGQPYVAYAESSTDEPLRNRATVMTYNGTAWVPLGTPRFTAGQAGDVSLAISPSGVPWIAFNEPDNQFKLAVMSFDGAAWGSVGSSLSTGSAGDVRIAFAPDGTPYIAFRDGGNGLRASVLKFQGGSWSNVGPAGFAGGANGAYFLSLAFAPNGTPYLVFTDYSNGAKACVMRFDGSAWVDVGSPDFSPSSATYLSLAFDPAGNPWVSFCDQIYGSYEASVMAFDGTSWVDRGRGISAGGTTYSPLAFAPDGTPYIAFGDSPDGKLSVKRMQIPVSPTVVNVDGPAAGAYAVDSYLEFTIHFSTAVDVVPLPALRLTIGSNTRYAGYYSGSGTSALVFRYQVAASDSGAVSVYNAPIYLLSSGSIKSSLDGADAVLTLNSVGSTSGITFGAPPAPTLTTPTTTNLGANQVTLRLLSSASGTGYFTLLPGANATPGTGAQVKAGHNASDAAAFRFGSVALTANTTATYTIGNLAAGTAYTVCFTADDGTTLQTTPMTTSFTTNAAVDLSTLTWAQVGTALSTGTADYERLAFAPDGTPYVAFQDYDLAHKITVKRFDGTSWVNVGSTGFSGAAADFISLAFAPNGTPYVAFKDDAHSYKATVMRFTAGAWSAVGSAGFSAGQACDESLGFAPDGTPYLAFRDVANGEKATVMAFNGAAWSVVGSVGVTPGTAYEVSLAFSPLGQPHIAYRDMAHAGKMSVMKWDGAAWVNVGVAGFSDDTAYPTHLVFAPDGTPFIAFQDAGHALKATVMTYTSGTWTTVGAAGFTSAAATMPTLAFAANGTPQVAFVDAAVSSKLTVVRFDGTSWVAVGTTGFSAGSSGFPSLAFAPDGRPWLAFKDNANSGNATVMALSATVPGTTPTITWSAPAAITYGTALSSTQLNAVATDGGTPVAGVFVYTPAAGTMLNAGAGQILSVAFTPTDTTTYTTASTTTTITVNKADQAIAFAPLDSRIINDAAFTLSATATSGLVVSYVSSNTAVATVSGSSITLVGAGSTNITASQAGNANYNPAAAVMRTLTVTAPVAGPVITADPATQSVTEGDTVTLMVTATGQDLAYEWRKDNVDIPGEHSRTLTLTNVPLSAAGQYTVIVTNGGATAVSAAAGLSVAPRLPAVTAQPQSQVAPYGGSVSLSVETSGTGPFTYQWYKDNGAIAGATNATLTLNAARPAMGGIYTVAVSNAAGTIRSNAATLNVGPRGLLRAYLGVFGVTGSTGAHGKFALYLRDDGTAVFLAYETSGRLGFIVRNVRLDANQHFQFTTKPINPAAVKAAHVAAAMSTDDTTVEGTIGVDGSITGTLSGSVAGALSAEEPPIVATAADVTGFYEAGVAGTSSGSYFIVNEGRQAFALTINGGEVDAATGSIDAQGRFAFTSETSGAIAGAIDCAAATLTTTVTTASGESRTCSGGNKDARADLERMVNVSGRGGVSASDPLIAGFVVTGTHAKRVLVRAVGPSLTNFGVPNALSAARLEVIHNGTSLAVATDWSSAANASEVADVASRIGAFPLAANSHDAALLLTVEPGAYTAIVTGQGAATGVALAEVYDATEGAIGPAERVINVSTRAHVGADDAALFSGFVIHGDVPKRVLIRGVGSSLAQFGIGNALPRLELTLWSGQTIVAHNADWSTSPDAAAIAVATADAGTFPLATGDGEAALLIYLQPGAYCAQVSGAGGSKGTAIAEIYELP